MRDACYDKEVLILSVHIPTPSIRHFTAHLKLAQVKRES